jgi:hypothetical protein
MENVNKTFIPKCHLLLYNENRVMILKGENHEQKTSDRTIFINTFQLLTLQNEFIENRQSELF